MQSVNKFSSLFLDFAKKSTNFSKKMVGKKFRDFMILFEKIKLTESSESEEAAFNNVSEFLMQSTDELLFQIKQGSDL